MVHKKNAGAQEGLASHGWANEHVPSLHCVDVGFHARGSNASLLQDCSQRGPFYDQCNVYHNDDCILCCSAVPLKDYVADDPGNTICDNGAEKACVDPAGVREQVLQGNICMGVCRLGGLRHTELPVFIVVLAPGDFAVKEVH